MKKSLAKEIEMKKVGAWQDKRQICNSFSIRSIFWKEFWKCEKKKIS